MRYIINDDDFEEWIKKLKKVQEENGMHGFSWTLQYVIEQMEIELQQHRKKDEE